MAFRIVDKKKLGDTGITKCTMICECANEFYEKEGECIPKGHQSIFHRYSNPVRNKNFFLRDVEIF